MLAEAGWVPALSQSATARQPVLLFRLKWHLDDPDVVATFVIPTPSVLETHVREQAGTQVRARWGLVIGVR